MVHRGLTSSVGDLAVVDDDGVTASAALVVSPANALGELGLGVGEEENVVVGDLVGLTPGAHNESIVVGKDGNNVDTLLAELGELLDVLGDVVGRADGGEGTGEGEEDDLLVGPLLGGEVVDGDTARGDLALVLGPGDVPALVSVLKSAERRAEKRRKKNLREDDVRGERVTSVDTRHCEGCCGGLSGKEKCSRVV